MAVAKVPPISLQAQGPVARRQALSRASRYVLLGATLVGVAVLIFLAIDVISTGGGRLSWDFINSYPSRNADQAGLRSSLIGTAWVMITTILLAIPLAIGTAVSAARLIGLDMMMSGRNFSRRNRSPSAAD